MYYQEPLEPEPTEIATHDITPSFLATKLSEQNGGDDPETGIITKEFFIWKLVPPGNWLTMIVTEYSKGRNWSILENIGIRPHFFPNGQDTVLTLVKSMNGIKAYAPVSGLDEMARMIQES